jgi:hypothetical protein
MLFEDNKNIFLIAVMFFLISLCTGCIKQGKTRGAMEVDSLLNIVYAIQDTISSSDVQMLHEIRQTLSDDLSMVYDSIYEQVINSRITTEYANLYSNVESCLEACNNYHEEIFLLENKLQLLLASIQNAVLPADSLDKKIRYESELLQDMQTRVDTNLGKIARHIASFAELKPQMDSLFIQSGIEKRVP